jgi:hypothetical protein
MVPAQQASAGEGLDLEYGGETAESTFDDSSTCIARSGIFEDHTGPRDDDANTTSSLTREERIALQRQRRCGLSPCLLIALLQALALFTNCPAPACT